MKITTQDIIKLVLSVSILVSFNVIVFSVIKNPELSENPLLNHIVGIIEGAIFVKYNFFWGSSEGSKSKDAIIQENHDKKLDGDT